MDWWLGGCVGLVALSLLARVRSPSWRVGVVRPELGRFNYKNLLTLSAASLDLGGMAGLQCGIPLTPILLSILTCRRRGLGARMRYRRKGFLRIVEIQQLVPPYTFGAGSVTIWARACRTPRARMSDLCLDSLIYNEHFLMPGSNRTYLHPAPSPLLSTFACGFRSPGARTCL